MTEVDPAKLVPERGPRLPPGPRAEGAWDHHRRKLRNGMMRAVAANGYDRAKVADIVREAQVSRRTFYEHFADKQECFLDVYEAATSRLVDAINEAVRDQPYGQHRMLTGMDVYLRAVIGDPELARVLLVEIVRVGPEGMRRRRDAYRQWAEMLARNFTDAEFTAAQWQSLIASVNERVLVALDDEALGDLPEIRGQILDLLDAVLTARRASTPQPRV
ncbi:TetR/AcrR family transcriptional regulator [Saccharopolyspora sp. NFXS83]|uniref:TetR/AcrR family transcriptional regulator n=1 Tax=Saccharopolyspora sp. NFXS83 TaxID=2993560 RepID=UPI00224B9114|nr:TetR/AcrR family transcriptional regulator [Saccharopolyspora sp. NFXS83]MCX2731118.1 TetR/AcrR family transcriptional regulator [Saccharopolyspora sp. NFXS83]